MSADRLREIVFGLVIAVLFAALALAIANLSGTNWLPVWILLVVAALGLAFFFLTRDCIPASRLVGSEVFWSPSRGWHPRKVKVVRVLSQEPEEPQFAFVELDTGEVQTAPISELSLTLSQRLRHSWRRK